jgi:hypothetical protein
MPNQPAVIKPSLWISTIVLVAAVVGGFAAWWSVFREGQEGHGSERFEYDLTEYKKIDPALIRYRETPGFAVPLKEPRAIAVGPENRIYVVGDKAIAVFDSAGAKSGEIALEDEPRCLTVAKSQDSPASVIYVGMKDHVEVYDPAGTRVTSWPGFGPKALLTSIASAESEIYVADAGNRIVWRCDASGKVLGQIGKRDEERHIPGFVIPSPYFDVAVSPDGLVRVANPGAHRVEGYTPEGHLEVVWGKSSLAIEGFCGCCNPANFTVLADGRFVTVEKGLPRVKVYDPEGQFESVVAGPEQLAPTPTITEETRSAHQLAVFDVAADSQGRILLLDPSGRRVRVFERLPSSDATTEKKANE